MKGPSLTVGLADTAHRTKRIHDNQVYAIPGSAAHSDQDHLTKSYIVISCRRLMCRPRSLLQTRANLEYRALSNARNHPQF